MMQSDDARHIYEQLIQGLKWADKKEIPVKCPLHGDIHPSGSINTETGKWYCHVCNIGGTAINLYMQVKGVNLKTAMEELSLNTGASKEIVATYDYTDQSGKLLFQEVRYKPKDFKQRRPNENGGWIWNLKGIKLAPFNLPEVVKASTVFVVEGPKDCLTIKSLGHVATTNPLGAGKWYPEYNEYFRGKEVVILPDNDHPGRNHAQNIASNLRGIAKSIKIVELPGLPEKGDITDWVNIPGNDKEKLLRTIATTDEWVHSNAGIISEDTWPDPIPFDNLSALPDFPIKTLPSIGQEIISIVSEVVQVDSALPTTIYLSVLAAALSKKVVIDLSTHTESPNLYTCGILESGERKTSTMGVMTKLLYDFQNQKQHEMSYEIKIAKAIYDTNMERLKNLQKRAAKESNYVKREQLEKEIIEFTESITEPSEQPVYVVDDITPEMLGLLMANNHDRMAVFSTEGGIFQTIAGRYDNKKGSNIDLFLKGHSGDPWSCHRIGRESQTMLKPALNMCLLVQPDVIYEIGQNKSFRGRGLTARFLYIVGKPHAGYRGRQTKTIPEETLQTYNQHIVDLLTLPLSEQSITLTPEAHARWNEFYEDIEKEMRSGGDLYYLKDWGSKLAGQVARIAGLLHFATYGAKAINEPISVNSVNNSCVIGSFFKEHAVAAFGLMQANPGIEAAKTILSYITREKGDSFKGRDVIRHTGIKTMEDVTP